jgi:hypothetical protein
VAARFEVVPAYHMSSHAFIGPPEVRAAHMTALREAFRAGRLDASRSLIRTTTLQAEGARL